mgnify:CR=1 FL=1
MLGGENAVLDQVQSVLYVRALLMFILIHAINQHTADRAFCSVRLHRRCPPGSTSGAASATCTDCSFGTAANPFQTACPTCLAGTIAPFRAMSACVDCAFGSFQNGTTPKTCRRCDAGSSVNGNNSPFSLRVSCTVCAFGKFSEFESSDECTSCQSGTFTNNVVGVQKCQSCPAGTYVDGVSFASCLPCNPGSISQPASMECEPCRAGTIAQTNLCVPCPEGQTTADRVSCTQCLEGTYANQTGSPSCLLAPAGT